MTGLRLRVGFCAAVAVIAASLADPIVEFTSNAGAFGVGHYTDHSNLDVLPALLAGFAILALYFVRRAPAVLSGQALSGCTAPLLPTIFILQVGALYVMETAEQIVVWGHSLGATIWLGGPLPISLAVHAAVAVAVLYAVARSKRTLAATTLRVIRLVLAVVRRTAEPTPAAARAQSPILLKNLYRAFRAIGERAPPLVAH